MGGVLGAGKNRKVFSLILKHPLCATQQQHMALGIDTSGLKS